MQACTPLRPSYANDMRDAALLSLGVMDKLNVQTLTMTEPSSALGGGGFGCNINDQWFK